MTPGVADSLIVLIGVFLLGVIIGRGIEREDRSRRL